MARAADLSKLGRKGRATPTAPQNAQRVPEVVVRCFPVGYEITAHPADEESGLATVDVLFKGSGTSVVVATVAAKEIDGLLYGMVKARDAALQGEVTSDLVNAAGDDPAKVAATIDQLRQGGTT